MPPLLIPVLVLIVTIPVVAGIVVFARRAERKRLEEMRAAADRMGFAFEEKGDLESIRARADLPLFGHGHGKRVANVMTGRLGDRETQVFDYQYTTGGGKDSHTYRQTVVLCPGGSERLPEFVLAPENVFHKIGQAFGYQDIDFDSSPLFSSRYLLRGTDEYAIRTVFSPDTLAFFEQHLGWHVEVRGGTVGIYHGGKRCPPEALPSFVEEASAALRALART